MNKLAQIMKNISTKAIEDAIIAPKSKPVMSYQPVPPAKVLDLYKNKTK